MQNKEIELLDCKGYFVELSEVPGLKLSAKAENTFNIFYKELGHKEVLKSVDIAFEKELENLEETYRYFCGICWNKIKKEPVFEVDL